MGAHARPRRRRTGLRAAVLTAAAAVAVTVAATALGGFGPAGPHVSALPVPVAGAAVDAPAPDAADSSLDAAPDAPGHVLDEPGVQPDAADAGTPRSVPAASGGAAAAPAAMAAAAPAAKPAAAAAPAAPVAGTPCTAAAKACVDVAARQAWLISGGKVTRGPVQVMTGDRDDPTPLGTFKVQWKAEQYTSRQYLVQMPYSVFFADGGVAFHEGNQETPSAGCVKLTHDDAVAWFQYLQVGDEVQVH